MHTRSRASGGFEVIIPYFKLTLRALLAFTKKHGIYAARLMLRLRLAFTNRTYRPAATPMPYSSATINKFCLAFLLGAQQHRQPHACARAQPRHHASQRKLARGIQLGDEDRGHTCWE